MSAMKHASMSVASLMLDESNPRFEKKTSSLEESLAALLGGNPEKLLRLARDIAKHGLNPTETVIIAVEGGQYVVVEGNRRIAVLKLLARPDLAPNERIQKQFLAIAKNNTFPRRIPCVLAESREQAKHWIKIRHTGENGGVGIVKWSPGEVSRFSGRSTPTERARLFVDAVSHWFADDADLIEKGKLVRKRLTNLGRMIADPDVRNRLGIRFEGDEVTSVFPIEKIKPVIEKIFTDLAGEMSVDQIKSKEQRRDYLTQVEDALPKLADRLERPEKYSKSQDGEVGRKAANPERKMVVPAESSSRRKREDFERRPFQGVTFRNTSLRTSEVLEEVKRIKIDEMPNISAVMIRAVVDIAVTEVAQRCGWKRNQDTLKGRIAAVLNQVDPKKVDPTLENARRLSQQDDGALALKNLHAFVHSWHSNPLATEVRKLSAAYGPMLQKIDDLLDKKSR